MNFFLKKLRNLTRRETPTGTDMVHLYSPVTGKDHYVLLADLIAGGGYPDWDSSEEYDENERVTYGLRLWESLQNVNQGHVPTGGVGDLWWVEVSASSSAVSGKVSITVTAANARACGGVPQTVMAAPGLNRFVAPTKLVVSKKAGAVVFNFTSDLVIKFNGGEKIFFIPAAELNIAGNVNITLPLQGKLCPSNTAMQLTTDDGSNASTGDGDIRFIMYYDEETVLT